MAASMTRRDVLALMLGAPAALAASGCSRGSAALPPAGEIVGASDGIGHRLRDGLRPRPPEDRWEDVGVVVVGAGVAGLSAAWRLSRAGFEDFVVLELEPKPGGTARSGESKVVAYPWGAHYLPVPMRENADLIALLDEMGIVEGRTKDGEPVIAEQFLCRDPEERVFFNGAWHEGLYPQDGASDDDLDQLRRFQEETDRWAAWRDGQGRQAFTIPVAACSDDPNVTALDRVSMGDWLAERGLRSPRLRWLVDYSCRDDYGLTVEQTSAWAGLFYFGSRKRHAGEESQPLITWPEGNGRLVAHLYEQVRAKTRLGLAVTEVVPAGDGREGVEVDAVDHAGTSAVGFRAKHVIFAAPQFLATHLIRGYREERGGAAAAFEYGSWMVANFHLTNRPAESGFPMAWDNVLYESPSLGYVAATHQRGIDRGPTVLTYYYPLCDNDPAAARRTLLDLGWDHWADVALTDLETAHPEIRSLVERLDVMRWGHAMIRPTPGFVWGSERRAAAVSFRGIHFAHSDLSGVALFEEAFHHGLRGADEVLASAALA